MKNFFNLLAVSLSLLAFNAHAANAHLDAKIVRQTIAAYMKENNIPGAAVELYVNGKPQAYYFGYANVEKKTPITQKTIFEIGSISKLMTSLLMAQQVDLAKMALNVSVRKYMPFLSSTYDNVTLQSLATHTSGLPFEVPHTIKSQTQLEKYLNTISLEEAPNEEWAYSNVGMGMLGYAVEAETHKNFDQMYRKNILSPLGMQPIGLVVSNRLKSFYAQGYDNEGKPVKPAPLGLFPAAYGVKVSADDMQRFLGAAIGLPGTPQHILYPMKMTQSAYLKLSDKLQGLGWQIHQVNNISTLMNEADSANLGPVPVTEIFDRPAYDGNALIDKTGTTNGFRAYMAVIPNKQTGIAILVNKNAAHTSLEKAGREILFKVNKML